MHPNSRWLCFCVHASQGGERRGGRCVLSGGTLRAQGSESCCIRGLCNVRVGGTRTCCGHKQASPRAFQFLPVCLFLHFRHRTEGEGVREVCFEWFGHRQANPRSPQFSVTCLFVHPVRVRCDLIGRGAVQAWEIPCAITIRLRSAVLAWSYACRDECAPSSRRS